MSDMVRTIQRNRQKVWAESKALAERAAFANRAFTPAEQSEWERLYADLESYDARIAQLSGQEQRDQEHSDAMVELASRPKDRDHDNPLRVTPAFLDAVQAALDSRQGGYFEANLEQRAALLTTTVGAPRVWGSNVLDGPRNLLAVAQIPRQGSSFYAAQFPKFTLPSADAGVGEGVTVVEFAASTAGTVVFKRYGRFTDLSEEALLGANSGAVTAVHRTAIARDLDSVLIGLVNTDAGAAVAFTADVKAAIRKSIATVSDNTASSPAELCVLANPADVSLIEDTVATGGETIGEGFPLFAGALVYASGAVPTGFMLVANLRAGCRFFEGRGLSTQTFYEVKTSVQTLATSLIGGFGTGSISGYAQKVDVVTP